jgi:hypothetical protein
MGTCTHCHVVLENPMDAREAYKRHRGDNVDFITSMAPPRPDQIYVNCPACKGCWPFDLWMVERLSVI